MSQFGADIFDDDSKPPTEPPTSGEPPKKRARKPSRRKGAAAEETPADVPAPPEPVADAAPGRAAAEEPGAKKGRRKPASKRAKAPEDSTVEAVPVAPPERVHDDLGDVLFPSRRAEGRTPTPEPRAAEPETRAGSQGPKAVPAARERTHSPEERQQPQREAARASEATPVETREPTAEPAEHEGGPPRERFDDDDGQRRGRRRGRRGRRGGRDEDRPNETGQGPGETPRPERGEPVTGASPDAGVDDAGEGGTIRTDEAADASTSSPTQDPFARRHDAPRHGRDGGPPRDRHRDGPRRHDGPRHGHALHGRDDRRFDRRHEDEGDDQSPPSRLPQRDLSTARRAPALPTPAAPRRAAVLVDVAALMQQARDCGGELSFRRLRKALLGPDQLVLGLAFVTPDVPPSGRGALAAAGFALRECADGNEAAAALQAATAEVPADAERLVLAGLGRGTGPAGGPGAERAGFRTAVDGDRGELLLGADCMFVP